MMAFSRFFCTVLVTAACLPHPPHAEADSNDIEIDNAQISLIQNITVAAPMAGIVESVTIKEGEVLKAGEPMVQFDAEQVQTELLAATAAHEAAQLQAASDIDARYARRTLEVRQRELQQSQDANAIFNNAIPETEIAKLQLVVDQSRLAIEQAEHELAIAAAQAREKAAATKILQAQLNRHSVIAPKDGVVVDIQVEAGEWIEPGKPLARLISTNPIRVECFIDGRVHGSELVGKNVEFQPPTPPRANHPTRPAIQGRVTFVSPELHPVTGQTRLWAELENSTGAVRAGMRGTLIIRNQ